MTNFDLYSNYTDFPFKRKGGILKEQDCGTIKNEVSYIMKDYENLLEQLRQGKVSELTVTPEEFMDFQPVLMKYRYRKSIVGKAQKGGGIVYYFNGKQVTD